MNKIRYQPFIGLIGRREAAPFSILNTTEIQTLQKEKPSETHFRGIKKKDAFSQHPKTERLSQTLFDARARRADFFLLKVVVKTPTTTLMIQNLAYPITCDPICRAASRRLNTERKKLYCCFGAKYKFLY